MQDEIKAAQKMVNIIIDFFVNYSFQVVGAIIIFVVGILVARAVASFLMKFFERKEFDVTLSKFAARLSLRSPPWPLGPALRSKAPWRIMAPVL